VARLGNVRHGRKRAWNGVVDLMLLDQLTLTLRAAAFPNAPYLQVPAGSTLRHLSVSGEISGQVLLSWHGVAALRGYGDIFTVLDGLVCQLSRGELPLAPDSLPEESVLDIHESPG
jgi:hypothetical protein